MIKKTLLMSVGTVVFIIGLIIFPLPLPFGIPIMIIGLSLMFKASDKVKRIAIKRFNKHAYSRYTWQKVRDYRLRKKLIKYQ